MSSKLVASLKFSNDLPAVEYKCERFKREVDDLEAEKGNSARLFQQLTDHIETMRETLDQHYTN